MTKKTIALLLALLLTGILYACDSVPDTSDINSDSIVSETGSPSDPTDTFLSLIQTANIKMPLIYIPHRLREMPHVNMKQKICFGITASMSATICSEINVTPRRLKRP